MVSPTALREATRIAANVLEPIGNRLATDCSAEAARAGGRRTGWIKDNGSTCGAGSSDTAPPTSSPPAAAGVVALFASVAASALASSVVIVPAVSGVVGARPETALSAWAGCAVD